MARGFGGFGEGGEGEGGGEFRGGSGRREGGGRDWERGKERELGRFRFFWGGRGGREEEVLGGRRGRGFGLKCAIVNHVFNRCPTHGVCVARGNVDAKESQ